MAGNRGGTTKRGNGDDLQRDDGGRGDTAVRRGVRNQRPSAGVTQNGSMVPGSIGHDEREDYSLQADR
jgi:hypothetical protein